MTVNYLVYNLASEAWAAQDEIWNTTTVPAVRDDPAEVTRRWAIPRERVGLDGNWVIQQHPTVAPVLNPPLAIEPFDPEWFTPPGTWNPGDKSPGIVLANADRDASNNISNWSIVRAARPRQFGKFYFEVVHTVIGNHGSPTVGIADPTTAPADGDYVGKQPSQFGMTGGGSHVNGFTADKTGGFGSGWGLAGAIAGFAVDLDARKVWVAINNIWLGLGNPGAGTNWFAHWDIPLPLYPAASMFFSITSDVVRYCGDASDQNFAPPAGFTAWDLE